MRVIVFSSLTLLFALACTSAAKGDDPPTGTVDSPLPVVSFRSAAGTTASLWVEVADDAEEQTCGLMHRTSMPADQGMLFVFTQDYFGGFWNRNTLIPLSVAYIAADGTIVDIVPMAAIKPGEQPLIQAVNNPGRLGVRAVIEANDGWFARAGIGIGDVADVSAAVARAAEAAPPPICREKGT